MQHIKHTITKRIKKQTPSHRTSGFNKSVAPVPQIVQTGASGVKSIISPGVYVPPWFACKTFEEELFIGK